MIKQIKNSIKKILIKKDALNKIPELLANICDNKKVYVIFDKNTYNAAGSKLAKKLKATGYSVEEVLLKGEHVVPDTDYFFKMLNQVTRDGFLIACGSGTINDLTRYLSYKLEMPYLVVATAPSMDGYASSVSPITVDGVKSTYKAVAPEAIIADLNVLQKAPWEMIQAGFGDLIGKISSLMDWKLSNILFDIKLNQQSINLVKEELLKIIELAGDLEERTYESIEVLIQGLINSGIAMQIEGNSRPASGTEHHISHFLEMYGEIHKKEMPPHGIKVALGEYFASRLYLKLYETDFSSFKISDNLIDRKENIKDKYLNRAQPVIDTLEERWEADRLDINLLKEKEADIKALIESNRHNLVHVSDYLKKADILTREDVQNINRNWLLTAVQSAFEIRNRYTVATLLYQVGLLERWSHQLVDNFFNIINNN